MYVRANRVDECVSGVRLFAGCRSRVGDGVGVGEGAGAGVGEE